MEAWDEQDRVRPIPIEDEDIATQGAPSERMAAPKRPWLPVVIAIAAVVVVVTSVSVFGALRFEDPEPFDPDAFAADVDAEEAASTTTIPPSLEETIPGVTDRLTIVSVDDEAIWTLLWDPSYHLPKPVRHEVPPSSTDALATRATFDRSGQFVAVGSCAGGTCGSWIGPPTDLGIEPDLTGDNHVTWHASEVGRLAWTTFDDETTTVMFGTANPLTGQVEDARAALTIPGLAELSHWDTHGFIVRNEATTAYSPTGEVLWRLEDAWPSSATDSIIAMVSSDLEWLVVDRATGEPIEDQRLRATLDDSTLWLSASQSTDLMARVTSFDDRLSLTVIGGGMRAPRIRQIDEPLVPLRFTENGRYFVFTNEEASLLTFLDWFTGAGYTVNLPEGHRLIGFYLG